MPAPRQYQFDVDTKRYLNRVNTYRSLNGLADIQKSDAVDIDNFVIGLKDLNLWNNATIWLMRRQHNIGTGNTVLAAGGGLTLDGTMFNSPTWGSNGITFVRTSDQYVLTRVTDILDQFGAFVVIDHDRNNNGCYIGQDRWSGVNGDGSFSWLLQRGSTSTTSQLYVGNVTTNVAFTNVTNPPTGFFFHGGTKSPVINGHSVNGGTVGSLGNQAGLFLGTKRMVIGIGRAGWGSGSALSGTMAVAAFFNRSFDPAQTVLASLNSLLRQTITKDILTT
jgi:hypothetical protein